VGGFAIQRLDDIPDVMGDYPGEMRMCTEHIGAEQVAITWRRMPAGTGGKGSYGHRHRTQEEVYLVVSGTLEIKLEDEVIEVSAGHVIRVSPDVLRSVWNEGPEDVELVITSVRRADGGDDDEVELVADFWPE